MNALKFQSVAAPNGMIANLFGPVEGRRHDSALLAMSGLLNQLQERSSLQMDRHYVFMETLPTLIEYIFNVHLVEGHALHKKKRL